MQAARLQCRDNKGSDLSTRCVTRYASREMKFSLPNWQFLHPLRCETSSRWCQIGSRIALCLNWKLTSESQLCTLCLLETISLPVFSSLLFYIHLCILNIFLSLMLLSSHATYRNVKFGPRCAFSSPRAGFRDLVRKVENFSAMTCANVLLKFLRLFFLWMLHCLNFSLRSIVKIWREKIIY